jgi:hypothetical protein
VDFKDVVWISRMLQWYSYSCMFFKGLPSMPKGEIVGMFSEKKAEYLFVIDGKHSPMMMNKRKWQDDDCMMNKRKWQDQ